MERLNAQRPPKGLSAAGLRLWGYLFVLAGVAAKAVIQNRLLAGNSELQGPADMVLAGASFVLLALEACAIPVFAFLLVEGFCHTGHFVKYLGRVALVAAVSEIPYNLAVGGGVLVLRSRNPVFALVLGLVLLWFLRLYAGKGFRKMIPKGAAILGALLWCGMLRIEHGVFLILMVAAYWFMRGKNMRVLVCAMVAAVALVLHPLYVVAPISVLTTHFYNEEKGKSNRILQMAAYPAMLLMVYFVSFCFAGSGA